MEEETQHAPNIPRLEKNKQTEFEVKLFAAVPKIESIVFIVPQYK